MNEWMNEWMKSHKSVQDTFPAWEDLLTFDTMTQDFTVSKQAAYTLTQ